MNDDLKNQAINAQCATWMNEFFGELTALLAHAEGGVAREAQPGRFEGA